jgi:hypothetical protein
MDLSHLSLRFATLATFAAFAVGCAAPSNVPEEKGETTQHETLDEGGGGHEGATHPFPMEADGSPKDHTHPAPPPAVDPANATAPVAGDTPPVRTAGGAQGSIGSCAGFNDALYCGQNFIALGDPNTLYECRSGELIERERCTAGCVATGTGVNDYCAR